MTTPDEAGLQTLLTPPELRASSQQHHQVEDLARDDVAGGSVVRDRHAQAAGHGCVEAQPSHGLPGSRVFKEPRQPGDLYLQIHEGIFFVFASVLATLDHFTSGVRKQWARLRRRGGQPDKAHAKSE